MNFSIKNTIYGELSNETPLNIKRDFIISSGITEEKLLETRVYYVRTDGNDSNIGTGNTSDTAFKTIQKAINTASCLSLGLFGVIIRVADGTYTESTTITGSLSCQNPNQPPLTIEGNTLYPDNCVIQTSGTCFTSTNGAYSEIRGFTLKSSSGNCITSGVGSIVYISDMVFAATPLGFHLECVNKGQIIARAGYSIKETSLGHMHCVQNSTIVIVPHGSKTGISLTGTPNFTSFFLGINGGYVQLNPSVSFTGAVGVNTSKLQIKSSGTLWSVGGSGCDELLNKIPGSLTGSNVSIESGASIENIHVPGRALLDAGSNNGFLLVPGVKNGPVLATPCFTGASLGLLSMYIDINNNRLTYYSNGKWNYIQATSY